MAVMQDSFISVVENASFSESRIWKGNFISLNVNSIQLLQLPRMKHLTCFSTTVYFPGSSIRSLHLTNVVKRVLFVWKTETSMPSERLVGKACRRKQKLDLSRAQKWKMFFHLWFDGFVRRINFSLLRAKAATSFTVHCDVQIQGAYFLWRLIEEHGLLPHHVSRFRLTCYQTKEQWPQTKHTRKVLKETQNRGQQQNESLGVSLQCSVKIYQSDKRFHRQK